MLERQELVVMRHARRLDEVDAFFVSTSQTWWDPPLDPECHQQIKDACEELHDLSLQVLVVSPFTRCLQTAEVVRAATRGAFDQIHIDYGTIQEWMWQGASIESALCSNALTGLVSVDDGALPAYPETQEQAHARASKALEDIGNRYDKHNILVITHGEVVNRSVCRILPWVSVIEAKHCCFTVSYRERDEDGGWGTWQLDISRSHGIQMLGL